MQVKEVFLKKINNFLLFLRFVIIVLLSSILISEKLNATPQEKIFNYLNTIKEFSSEFLQTQNEEISEGFLYLKNKRFKIDYIKPSKINIVISEKKAMYHNVDLNEVQFFDPRNTPANIFYKIFFNKEFFNDASYIIKENFLTVKKNVMLEGETVLIKVVFENNPLQIRKISIVQKNNRIDLGLINLNFNPSLEKKFFSMVNPIIN